MSIDLIPWRAKKIGDDDMLAYLVPETDFRCDGGKLVVHGTATTDTMDPQRDIILPPGVDTGRHQKNPIVLLNHRKDLPGIAKAKSPDGNYTVRLIDEHRLDTSNYFDQHSKLSVQSFRLIESGALGGLSIGFVPKPGCIHKSMGADKQPVYIYSQVELLEITHAPIGVNPDAVVHAVEKGFGGESLLPELKDLLIPYLPTRKPLVRSGWEPTVDATETKAMGTVDDTAGGSAVGMGGDDVQLTPSSSTYHVSHTAFEQVIGFLLEQEATNENERTKADIQKMIAYLHKAMDVCRDGHAAHREEFTDQPPLPGVSDTDLDDETEKALKESAQKALEDYADRQAALERRLANEDLEKVGDARETFGSISRDPRIDRRTRILAKAMAEKLATVKGTVPVEKAVKAPPEDYAQVADFLAGLAGTLAKVETGLGGDRKQLDRLVGAAN